MEIGAECADVMARETLMAALDIFSKWRGDVKQ